MNRAGPTKASTSRSSPSSNSKYHNWFLHLWSRLTSSMTLSRVSSSNLRCLPIWPPTKSSSLLRVATTAVPSASIYLTRSLLRRATIHSTSFASLFRDAWESKKHFRLNNPTYGQRAKIFTRKFSRRKMPLVIWVKSNRMNLWVLERCSV